MAEIARRRNGAPAFPGAMLACPSGGSSMPSPRPLATLLAGAVLVAALPAAAADRKSVV